jgi:hypothetical protein
MDEEDHFIVIFSYLSDSRNNLVMTIRSIVKTLVLDEVTIALIS